MITSTKIKQKNIGNSYQNQNDSEYELSDSSDSDSGSDFDDDKNDKNLVSTDEEIDIAIGNKTWVHDAITKKQQRKKKRENSNPSKGQNMNGSKRCERLLLNDALKNKDTMEGWSDARRNAYLNRDKNPNAYYYRFNDPNEEQKNGKWTKEEHYLFMKRLTELGSNDKWGVFSQVIPGRVGYQCSNYYRQLIKEKCVIDPNYYVDNTGKLHFRRFGEENKKNKTSKNIQERLRRFGFTVTKDSSGVWQNLPCRHPNAPPSFVLDNCNGNENENNNNIDNNPDHNENHTENKNNDNNNDNMDLKNDCVNDNNNDNNNNNNNEGKKNKERKKTQCNRVKQQS